MFQFSYVIIENTIVQLEDILLTVDDLQCSRRLDLTHVSSVEEAVFIDGVTGLLGVFEVALKH